MPRRFLSLSGAFTAGHKRVTLRTVPEMLRQVSGRTTMLSLLLICASICSPCHQWVPTVSRRAQTSTYRVLGEGYRRDGSAVDRRREIAGDASDERLGKGLARSRLLCLALPWATLRHTRSSGAQELGMTTTSYRKIKMGRLKNRCD